MDVNDILYEAMELNVQEGKDDANKYIPIEYNAIVFDLYSFVEVLQNEVKRLSEEKKNDDDVC